jgi:hypothetical protein
VANGPDALEVSQPYGSVRQAPVQSTSKIKFWIRSSTMKSKKLLQSQRIGPGRPPVMA